MTHRHKALGSRLPFCRGLTQFELMPTSSMSSPAPDELRHCRNAVVQSTMCYEPGNCGGDHFPAVLSLHPPNSRGTATWLIDRPLCGDSCCRWVDSIRWPDGPHGRVELPLGRLPVAPESALHPRPMHRMQSGSSWRHPLATWRGRAMVGIFAAQSARHSAAARWPDVLALLVSVLVGRGARRGSGGPTRSHCELGDASPSGVRSSHGRSPHSALARRRFVGSSSAKALRWCLHLARLRLLARTVCRMLSGRLAATWLSTSGFCGLPGCPAWRSAAEHVPGEVCVGRRWRCSPPAGDRDSAHHVDKLVGKWSRQPTWPPLRCRPRLNSGPRQSMARVSPSSVGERRRVQCLRT